MPVVTYTIYLVTLKKNKKKTKRRSPQVLVTKGEDPSEGAELIAAVVEDIVVEGRRLWGGEK